MQGIDVPYTSLEETLECIVIQVQDSMPYVRNYIPKSIKKPSELFKFLKNKTQYEKDPEGEELLQTVQTLMNRRGRGDCDCFTILTLAACEYLGFKPLQVAIVGKTDIAPTHIYARVWDKDKKKFCAMDLTNPEYCMERSYKYRQYLPLTMRLRLEDDFPNLASVLLSKKSPAKKAAKAQKKQANQQKKVVKKQEKSQRKIVKQKGNTAKKTARVARKVKKTESKTIRKGTRQDTRTNRVVKKGERKGLNREKKVVGKKVKLQRKENKLIKATGRGAIIKARQEGRLQRVQFPEDDMFSPSSGPAGGGIVNLPEDLYQEQEGSYDHNFPEDDIVMLPDDSEYPGSEWQADETEDADYEILPEYEEEFEDDDYVMQDLSAIPLIPALITGTQKIIKNIKAKGEKAASSKVGQAIQRGAGEAQQLLYLKRENAILKQKIQADKTNKILIGVGSGVGGTLLGILIRSTISR